MATYDIELKQAGSGYTTFSVVDHPEFGDFAVALTRQFCKAHGILTGAKITIEEAE